MTAFETAGLALCGDKYKISRVVQEALKPLGPTSAVDVFPALICVTYASFPDLEVKVSKIIQQETDKVVQHADFLKLDEECVLYIMKQNKMNIGELELWNNIVCWAKNQVEENPPRTVRDCLAKVLGYVRFLTFTSDEILEHVLPAEALTPEEFMDLVLAVTKKQPLKSSMLCNVQEKRALYKEEEVSVKMDLTSVLQNESGTPKISRKRAVSETEKNSKHGKFAEGVAPYKPKPCTSNTQFNSSWVFKASDYFEVLESADLKFGFSILTIIPRDTIKIESFTCKSESGRQNVQYKYKCRITITKTEGDNECKQEIVVEGRALCNDEIVLPLKFKSGMPIVMSPGELWEFQLKWNGRPPTHVLLASDDTWGSVDATNTPIEEEGNLILEYKLEYFHVLQVAYKTQ